MFVFHSIVPPAAGVLRAPVPRRQANGGNIPTRAAPEWQAGVPVRRCHGLGQRCPPRGLFDHGLGTVPTKLDEGPPVKRSRRA